MTADARPSLLTRISSFVRNQLGYPMTLRVEVAGVRPKFRVASDTERFRVEALGGEREFVEAIVGSLRPDDVFFDIGASVGAVAVPGALRAGRVVAFEPDAAIRTRLEGNVAANRLANVEVVGWAVGAEKGKLELFSDGVDAASPSLVDLGRHGASTTVEVDSIDAALREGRLPRPTVLKIDIEGAEHAALTGMRELLASATPPRLVFLESHPEFLPKFGSSEAEVLALLEAAGYQQNEASHRSAENHFVFARRES